LHSYCPFFYIRLLKLEILTFICSKENTQEVLRELQIHIKHSNQQFVCATVRAVGRVADADPEVAGKCMEGLMHLMACNKENAVIGESVVVLRQLLQQSSGTEISSKVLHQLAKMLIGEQSVDEALARSSIVWLVGEFHDVLSKVSPDILRILAAGFPDEATETKMQIMNLAIKLALRLPDDENVESLMTYVLEMARYDMDTDLRDRSRFMTALMGLAPSNDSEGSSEPSPVDEVALEELSEHAMGIMLAPKLPPVTLLGTVDVEVTKCQSMVTYLVDYYYLNCYSIFR
jgi:AP-3 complex subunit beta